MLFQSTPPVRGATGSITIPETIQGDFNPRPPCGGRLDIIKNSDFVVCISIHAPRAGGDRQLETAIRYAKDISIHAPRAGGDHFFCIRNVDVYDFNPRPPCGGRQQKQPKIQAAFVIMYNSFRYFLLIAI